MQTLILPGLNGSDEGHWQWHWQNERPDCLTVQQADWTKPAVDCWVAKVETELEAANEAYVVAHSLACLVVAKLAARPAAKRIKAALLVAPCDPQLTGALHPGMIDFGHAPVGTPRFPSLIVGSLNDLYMPLDKLTLLGQSWSLPVHNLGLAGHINIASGYGRWAGGYQLMDQLASVAKAQPVSSKDRFLSVSDLRPC
ncbi:RBBP9/YdeN family alpha/beta hydrolase [Rhizobium panacihumi]|uniref:RBBP9/YdeN family alpha/beta hydrolase n=1 Tax=Rhizobium panacihumi TaxID=2008450 RepID=UPI003D7A5982